MEQNEAVEKNKLPEIPEPGKWVVMPSGAHSIYCIDRKGKHSVKASSIMNGNEELYFPALMHVLCRDQNGQQQPMEFFLEMPGRDFDTLMAHIMGN